MTLQNDVLNPGPLLNQHPRKACKSMRARVGRPCCGGYPCQPPKMHQISKEVVRDWSLWGSWCFSIFSWFLEIFCDKKMQDVRSFSCMCSCEWCLWMLMIFVMPFYLVFISCSYIMILLVSCCIFFLRTLFREPQHKKKWTATMTLKAEARHGGCSRLRHNLNICGLLRSGLPKVVELQKT